MMYIDFDKVREVSQITFTTYNKGLKDLHN